MTICYSRQKKKSIYCNRNGQFKLNVIFHSHTAHASHILVVYIAIANFRSIKNGLSIPKKKHNVGFIQNPILKSNHIFVECAVHFFFLSIIKTSAQNVCSINIYLYQQHFMDFIIIYLSCFTRKYLRQNEI